MEVDENEANEAEAKKRSKDVTPASASRLTKQPKTRGTDETHEKDARRTLFKSPPEAKPEEQALTEYRTFYNKDTVKQKGTDERWKRQQASVEERSMQAATPATAKKKPTVSTKAQTLSKKMDTQLQQAQSMMDKMQKALAEQDHPPYIAEMQQQMQSMQETMGQLEEITTNLRQDVTDVEIMANYVHDTLYKQQQQEVALQTVAKGWPTAFSDSERDSVISWYADKAGVANHFTTTHGRYTYGKYKKSPITILHWQTEWAKNTFETYIYKHYNRWRPVTIWDWQNKMVYHGNELHRINFTPQTSDMERQINLTMQAALHILTNCEQSDLSQSWNRLAAKWQDKLAIKSSDNMVVFKVVRDQADPKFLHLHIHKDYHEIIRDNWLSGWKEANAKTKFPDYNYYVYIVKFAVLRSNEEYRIMRDAKFGSEEREAGN
jgi:hypothetical protein